MNQLLPTTTTADEKNRDAKCAVLPVGSFEQHGDYLPPGYRYRNRGCDIPGTVKRLSSPPASAGHDLMFP
jgi:hypothetical protein